ncbi:hypothetical protein [Tepidimonas ignava]|uniref:type IV pilus modification PilV family protein n=1 Tax=Tepidimonas ignava TaxID=114249 RepID=UPI002FD9994A
MKRTYRVIDQRRRNQLVHGYALVEALVSLAIVLVGVGAFGRLQTVTSQATREARDHTVEMQAVRGAYEYALAAIRATYAANCGVGIDSNTLRSALQNAASSAVTTFHNRGSLALSASVSFPQAAVISLTVTATGSQMNPKPSYTGTLLTTDTCALAAATGPTNNAGGGTSGLAFNAPTGRARPGDFQVVAGANVRENTLGGYKVATKDNRLMLLDSSNKNTLELDCGGDCTTTTFVTIEGKVFADNNAITPKIRISSYGQCAIDNSPTQIGSSKFYYWNYKCYTGPEWYGNIGIEPVSSSGKKWITCLGASNYNNETTFATSPATSETQGNKNTVKLINSSRRAYRGFVTTGNNQFSITGTIANVTYPAAGTMKPSNYSLSANAASYFNNAGTAEKHHFLLTQDNSCPSTGDFESKGTYSALSSEFNYNVGDKFCLQSAAGAENPACPSSFLAGTQSGITGCLTYVYVEGITEGSVTFQAGSVAGSCIATGVTDAYVCNVGTGTGSPIVIKHIDSDGTTVLASQTVYATCGNMSVTFP